MVMIMIHYSIYCVYVEHPESFSLKKRINNSKFIKKKFELKLPLAFANNVRSAFIRSADTFNFSPKALLTSRLAIAVQVLGLVAGRGTTVAALSFDSLVAFLRGLVFTNANGVFSA